MRRDLRYKISDWEQATQCLSNNSRDLHILVSKFLLDRNLEGEVIRVVHSVYGTLFAALTNGHGRLITDVNSDGITLPFMTTDQILVQLEKLGFIIFYSPDVHLSGDQLSMLINLQHMNFDKLTVIRKLDKGGRITRTKVVAFNSKYCADLLQFGVKVTDARFNSYLSSGYLYNVTDSPVNKFTFVWDWLTYVCNISDVLQANVTEGVVDVTHLPPTAPVPFNSDMMSEPAVPNEESYYEPFES